MAELWNGLLTGLGTALSFFYDVIPSYVVAILVLTVAVRLLLLPLTVKQTRSMQAMQKIQPKIKELQRKHKGDRQKMNEELMKLYKEHQVNPLGGCLPLLLQLPVFFALYQVLTRAAPGSLPGTGYLPEGSQLAGDIAAQRVGFLGLDISLACSPTAAGRGLVEVVQGAARVDCGSSFWVALPVYLLVGLMVFTTYYQQRQMQRVSSGPQAQQMQLMGRIMPIVLGFISINISAGVLVYWVTTNAWQIGQQYLMLRSRSRVGEATGGDGRPEKRSSAPPSKPAEEPRSAKTGSGKPSASGKSGGGKNARGRKKRSKR